MFNPIIEALKTSLTREMGQTVQIDLLIYKTYAEAQDALVSGQVDIVRFGPVSYILAKDLDPDIQLLAMENKKGGRSFNGVIAVRADSAFESPWRWCAIAKSTCGPG